MAKLIINDSAYLSYFDSPEPAVLINKNSINFVIPSDFRDGYQVLSETINPLLNTYDSALEQYNEKINEKVNNTSNYLKIRAFNLIDNNRTFFNYESIDDLDENTNFRIWNTISGGESFAINKSDLAIKINEQKSIENNRLQKANDVCIIRVTKDSDNAPLKRNLIS